MIKVTPNTPETESTSPYTSLDSKKLHQAAERALDFHLLPCESKPKTVPISPNIFTVVDGIDTERLLVNLSETLASANVMASDLAFELEGSRRHFALGIQQMIELGELLANRVLDKVDPRI
ncbi:DUF6124 family protein [Pseudomonas fluorescens]|uniref:DUF3077 domain-containing protein n=1 Tax=Pseudomonas fluorescens TaxID=294 RepID=A0A5E7DFI6_PSEFL|nr:DUF6124 family protein [Pseudomonas fluorescens]VVO06162.1 hypothetical protein PS723_03040 [Pseudomonas fluorescens]